MSFLRGLSIILFGLMLVVIAVVKIVLFFSGKPVVTKEKRTRKALGVGLGIIILLYLIG